MILFFSPVTPNCNNSDGGNNGVELRDLNNPNASQTTPDELTGLTEHLRRHTGKQCQQARLQSPRQGFLNFCGNAHVTRQINYSAQIITLFIKGY